MAMLQLLIDEIQPARHNIHLDSTLGCSRTYHTLEIARQRWQDAKLTFVIGADLIFQLPNWYRIDQVLERVDLLVIPRPGYPVKDAALAELRRRGARLTIADLTGPDISSTAYREGGETEGLTPPIAAYIHQEHLYAWQDASREKQPIR
jgi:nicotinate-nucleotide adenylyltransferase